MRIFVLLPLLIFLSGCNKEPVLKYEIKGNTVTITDCDENASGKLVIPAKIEGNPVTNIGEKAFIGCSLTSIIIPDSVTSIGRNAFQSCTSLTSITFGTSSKLTSIGLESFLFCNSLTSITIPESVTNISHAAFISCKNLTAVTFLGDAPKVGKGVFAGAPPTIYRKPEAKGWGDTFAGRPVKLISEKP